MGDFFWHLKSNHKINTSMNINEVLQGLSNLGGETPRVTKPKRIKEIKPGKKHKNFRKPKGPLSIDLSKLGEEVEAMKDLVERAKQVKAKSKMPKKMKPNTGHESPHPYQGQLVGEADDEGMYNNPELRRAAKKDQDVNKEFAIGNFYAWAMEKYPEITLGQMKERFPQLQREYAQEKTMRRVEPNKVPTVSSAFDDEKERMKAKGIQPKTSFESVVEDTDIPMTQCPQCGGAIESIYEAKSKTKKDACYHKVKRRYKVWPSAYASGALVQCRKKGAKNWGNKSKKK